MQILLDYFIHSQAVKAAYQAQNSAILTGLIQLSIRAFHALLEWDAMTTRASNPAQMITAKLEIANGKTSTAKWELEHA